MFRFRLTFALAALAHVLNQSKPGKSTLALESTLNRSNPRKIAARTKKPQLKSPEIKYGKP
jgi:hypothetical protein